MVHLSSIQFENDHGEVLYVDLDSKSKCVKLRAPASFTIDKLEDLESIINEIASTLIEIKEINRKK